MSYAYLEHLSDACLVTNEEGEILFWNNSFLILSNYKEREVRKIKFAKDLIKFEEEISELSVECGFNFANQKEGFGLVRKVSIDQSVLIIIKDLFVEKNLHQKYHSQLQELKQINQNLEQMVADRTAELRRSNKYLFDLLDSFKQAIFMVNPDGKIDLAQGLNLSVVTELFPDNLAELFATVMTTEQSKKWIALLFSNALPFEEMVALAPQELVFANEVFKITYYPYYSEVEQLESIILAMTNVTEETKVRQDLDVKTKFAASLLKASQSGGRFQVAMSEVEDLLEELLNEDSNLQFFKANLHALKGLFSYYGPVGFDQLVHQIELSDEGIGEKQLNVKELSNNFKKILNQIRLLLPSTTEDKKILPLSIISEVFQAKELDTAKEILTPFVFINLEEISLSMGEYAQELGQSSGKDVKYFSTSCAGFFLDSSLYKLLHQFLIQGLRNAVAHGMSENSDQNSIAIEAKDQGQSCLIQIKTKGRINKKLNDVSILSGLNQGVGLVDRIAKGFGATLNLSLDEENGTSCSELALPYKYLKRKKHV